MSLFQELKRRNVFRVGAAYAVAAWIIRQLTDVVGDILDLPDWGGKLSRAVTPARRRGTLRRSGIIGAGS